MLSKRLQQLPPQVSTLGDRGKACCNLCCDQSQGPLEALSGRLQTMKNAAAEVPSCSAPLDTTV